MLHGSVNVDQCYQPAMDCRGKLAYTAKSGIFTLNGSHAHVYNSAMSLLDKFKYMNDGELQWQ